jgi:hypothetical protein
MNRIFSGALFAAHMVTLVLFFCSRSLPAAHAAG